MDKKKVKGIRMYVTLLCFTILPLVIIVAALSFVVIGRMRSELENGVYDSLSAGANSLASWYEKDIKNDTLSLDSTLAEDTVFIDSLKEQNIELIFYKADEVVMSSIKDSSNATGRNIGEKADSAVWEAVKGGNSYKASKVKLGNNSYYICYQPVYDTNGQIWGMAAAGKTQAGVVGAERAVTNIFIIIAFAVLVICSGIAVYVGNVVSSPLKVLAREAKNFATGDISGEIKAESHIVETVMIINGMRDLQTALKNALGAVKESTEAINAAVVDVDDKTSNNVESVSQINDAINEVAETSQAVAENAQTMSEKAINLGNDIEKLADNVANLGVASAEISQANSEATGYMHTVMTSSDESVAAVVDISEKINKTNAAVENIRSCVQMIEEISSQTNLLSLNASIEAARAGEAGRGFAVVAEEIRKLADDSAASAGDIKNIVDEVIELSNETVKVAEEVSRIITNEKKYIAETQVKFALLSDSVDRSIDEIQLIREMSEELNEIKEQLTGATSDLGAISEELGASAEEVSASCHTVTDACTDTQARTEELRAINEHLSEAMAFFKL